MNKIVIVEDKLGRGISLAEQFEELLNVNPELNIVVSDVCYFCTDAVKAKRDIEETPVCKFNIRPVELINFNKIMDEYLCSGQDRYFLVMDFLLDNDGSEGIPMKRVNIRYARNKGRCDTDRLWFYTGSGPSNKRILDQLVKNHTFEVVEVDDDYLRLNMGNRYFWNEIRGNSAGKYIYPAVFTKETDGGYSVIFNDLESCYTCGDTLEEAMKMAEDALALVLYGYEADNKKIPSPTPVSAIPVSDNELVSLVRCDTMSYRKRYSNKEVRH